MALVEITKEQYEKLNRTPGVNIVKKTLYYIDTNPTAASKKVAGTKAPKSFTTTDETKYILGPKAPTAGSARQAIRTMLMAWFNENRKFITRKRLIKMIIDNKQILPGYPEKRLVTYVSSMVRDDLLVILED